MLRNHESGDRTELDRSRSAGAADLLAAQDAARRVHTSDALRAYVVALLRATREDARSELGASPRAGLMLLRAAKARALLSGRDHALPDDVQALAELVLSHRVVPAPEALDATGTQIVARRPRRDPRALGGTCGPPPSPPRSGCSCSWSRATFDAEPLYVPGVAFALLGSSRAGLGRARERSGSRVAARRRRADGARGPARRGPRPRAGRAHPAAHGRRSRRSCSARPCRSRSGAARWRCGSRRPSPAAGAACSPPVRVVVRDPLGLAAAHGHGGGGGGGPRAPAGPPGRRRRARAGRAACSRRARAGRGWPRRSSSTACGRTARARRPRASTGGVFARTGELWERKLLADADSRPLLVLDPRTAGGEEGGLALDAAVRALASLTVALAKEGGCSVLLPGDRRPVARRAGPQRLGARARPPRPGRRRRARAVAGGRRRSLGPRRLRRAPGRAAARRGRSQGGGGVRVLVVPDGGAAPGRSPALHGRGLHGLEPRGRRQEVA